ncbi:indole-3-glycerol phosphate synthase TrpC [Clostridium sp. SYSU_GA19001]|uniref:indole-3-glycerol phosphate synthase TrpC n=1 Tax=Clostridium caldaquaticum TaxID=2940653 RepID=UPI002076E799|nr:indole-3-glycerol phosphate synthase TrpC [Clostridium caldaquaticum]MCM8710139.1 indole-3-glycerol phosphate synthase TrpC [Clostridium caldaquaticum]
MILDEIVAVKKKQLEIEKEEKPLENLIKNSKPREIRNFEKALSGREMSIIAEIKKASPSKGVIIENFNHKAIAKVYDEVDIDAISVLTEKYFFKGNDEYIKDVKIIADKPVLRKDFIIEEYQIYQALDIGADAILLIAAILPGKLKRFYDLASSLGLHVLIEVHNESELEEALKSGGRIIGINNRDLKTFHVSLKHTEKLKNLIPKDKIVVSESGISNADDIKYLKSLGVSAILVGETFMRIIKDRTKVNEFVRVCKDGIKS